MGMGVRVLAALAWASVTTGGLTSSQVSLTSLMACSAAADVVPSAKAAGCPKYLDLPPMGTITSIRGFPNKEKMLVPGMSAAVTTLTTPSTLSAALPSTATSLALPWSLPTYTPYSAPLPTWTSPVYLASPLDTRCASGLGSGCHSTAPPLPSALLVFSRPSLSSCSVDSSTGSTLPMAGWDDGTGGVLRDSCGSAAERMDCAGAVGWASV
mmetsp:Transcript_36041/g.89871  ORF Transcript_36041/g.89871 Transcript_36041/m.89871 type:complete len:211 (-) Transcript_36041:72-704(-)